MALFTLNPPPQNTKNVPNWLAAQYKFLQWALYNLDEENLTEPYKLRLKSIEKQIKEIEETNKNNNSSSNVPPWQAGDRLHIPPWTGEIATSFLKGTGTEIDPYIITTAEHLSYFRDTVNKGNTYNRQFIKLQDNINLGNVEWVPISDDPSGKTTFDGTFDGDFYSIFNLKVTLTKAPWYGGLFGYTSSSCKSIKNLIADGEIVGNLAEQGCRCGVVVGSREGGYLENICTLGSVSNASSAGGIAGVSSGSSGSITKCVNRANVLGTFAGGISGSGYGSTVDIVNCYNTAKITGTDTTGGIIGAGTSGGYYYNNNIDYCYNIGKVTGGTKCGAIIGSGDMPWSSGSGAKTLYNYFALSKDTYTNTVGTGTVASDMQTQDFVDKINAGAATPIYAKDNNNSNGGFPVFVWETTI